MKRSHSSDDDQEIDFKKTKNEPICSNDNYYVIRKAKSSVSTSSLNLDHKSSFKDHKSPFQNKLSSSFDRKSTSSLFDKKDRYKPFDKTERFIDNSKSSFKSKSTSSLNKSPESKYRYEYKFTNPIFHKHKDKQVSKPEDKSSTYIIRKSGDGQTSNSTNSLKDQFINLVKNKNLTYNFEYLAKLTINGKSIRSNSCKSAEEAEKQIIEIAIKELQNETTDESMIEEPNETDQLIQEIKSILKRQDNYLLFKDEIPNEYKKIFRRKIIDNWFEAISSKSSFSIERHGSGNLVSIRLV